MNNKDISKFLPKHLRNEDVRNFISGTTQTLFDESNAEYSNYFIGHKVGGSYDYKTDPYAIERTKLRQDYQLEPSLVSRNDLNGKVEDVLFFEDLLNSFRSNGVDISSHERIFNSEIYTYAPPIDYDMLINYGNYYWMPEGVPSIRVLDTKANIEGKDEYVANVPTTSDIFPLTNGNHVILNDGREYIVTGVGDAIELIEFDLSNNKPARVSSSKGTYGTELIQLFPKEYITIERGSIEDSPWTRNNAWYHIDAVFPAAPTTWNFKEFDESRRAIRPIVQYQKNIELFNYVNEPAYKVDVFIQHEDFPESGEVDGIPLIDGLTAITNIADGVWRYNEVADSESGEFWERISGNPTKVLITDGVIFRGGEYQHTGTVWYQLQSKREDTQEIVFNLYNSDNTKTAKQLSDIDGSNFNGVSIFGYKTTGAGLTYDFELGMDVGMKTNNTGSDFVFSSTMSEYIVENRDWVTENTQGVFYKLIRDLPLPEDRFYEFTIRDDENGDSPSIYVNNEEMPTIVLEPNTSYIFDFSDGSTTRDNIFKRSYPISIREKGTGVPLVQYAKGDSSLTKYNLYFSKSRDYEYFTNVDGKELVGNIIVREVHDGVYLLSEYRESGNEETVLRETINITDDSKDITHYMSYYPISDSNVTLKINGANISPKIIGKAIHIPQGQLVKDGFIEIEYKTYETIAGNINNNVTQLPPVTLSSNPFNGTPTEFNFSDLFDHIGGVIGSQVKLEGAVFGNNNYRDTIKDHTKNGSIIKSESSIAPSMFLHSNDNFNIIRAIDNSRLFYQNFKNQLIVETEEYLRDADINSINIIEIFDQIVSTINTGKNADSAFNNSNMFAHGRGFVDLSFSRTSSSTFSFDFELDESSVVYIHLNSGIATVDIDYDLIRTGNTYRVAPKTFSLGDIVSMRLYENIEPSFCPATPQKLGFLVCDTPRLQIEKTNSGDILFLIGHDSSKTRAYTSIEEYNDGIIDERDMILLEFEKRVYNNIDDDARSMDRDVITVEELVTNSFRKSTYEKSFVDKVIGNYFFRWSNANSVDYSKNNNYTEGNPWTYNYSTMLFNGSPLKGHWTGIYKDIFGTITPHKTPWEMLGFKKKPTWWDAEYGSSYASSNTVMWNDIEKGIIRHGERDNLSDMTYLSKSNKYRREGLSSYLPVDASGNLKDPISSGVSKEPTRFNAKLNWSVIDSSPSEMAWKIMSDYQFTLMKLIYVLSPVEFCSKLWSSSNTRRRGYDSIWVYDEQKVHGKDIYVDGISQWVYDLLRNDNYDTSRQYEYPYNNLDIVLSYKVGGYVNENEVKLLSESFSPTTETDSPQNRIPREDINLLVYQSKDIAEEKYSGVIIERVADNVSANIFAEGLIYDKDDIIYLEDDKSYYKKSTVTNIKPWDDNGIYNLNDEVQFGNRWYVCTYYNVSSSLTPDLDTENWRLREFVSYEWAILISPPKTKKTRFKVYGYDISDPYFTIVKPVRSNNIGKIKAYGSNSKPITVPNWVPNTRYKVGDMVRFGENTYKVFLPHVSSVAFDSNNWELLQEVPRTQETVVEYYMDSGFDTVTYEYGTIFENMDEVVEFLVGYGWYLESRGWSFDELDTSNNTKKNWVMSSKEFVGWAIENTHENAVITLSPFSDTVKFKPEHGVVSILNQQNSSIYNLLGFNGNPIDITQTKVTRNNDIFKLKSDVPVYYIKFGIKEYEHAICINNTTIFGDINYDPLLGNRVDRLEFIGTKTTDWNGKLYAPGFIITPDGIKPNFDTSAKDIKSFNDMSIVSSREVLNELKYHNVGYQKRSYLEDLKLDNKSQIDFYSGFIRQKGTESSYNKILRSNSVNTREYLGIAEEWAFKESAFGGTRNYSQIEFLMEQEELIDNPQMVRLSYNGISTSDRYGTINVDIDDNKKWLTQPSRFQDAGTLFKETESKYQYRTAGYVLYQEHEIKAKDFKSLTKRLENIDVQPEKGMTVWLSTDSTNGYSWSVYTLDDTNLVITEILDGGSDGSNSAILRANNVHIEKPYGLIDGTGKFRNITFYHIRDDIYIIVEENDDIFVTLDENSSLEDLFIMQWKPLRIMSDSVSRLTDTIEQHLTRYDITPYDGMYIYKDEQFYGMGNWEVYQYTDGGTWKSIRQRNNVVDSELLHDTGIYDTDDMLIEYLRIYDPLAGMIPGARLDQIDVISGKDPVNYELSTVRQYNSFKELVGHTWWDTSQLVYVDYNIGNQSYRESYWGVQFPDSEVVIYEWVVSDEPPENYEQEVKSVEDYIESEEYSYNLGNYTKKYYFWVKNATTIGGHTDRKMTANQIATTIKYPSNNGFPMLSVIDNYNLMITDEARVLGSEDVIVKIGYKLRDTTTKTHTHWMLVPETPSYNEIPDFIFNKMIDSVLGFNESGNVIPFSGTTMTQRYGNEHEQIWFKDTKQARKIFFKIINDHIKKININNFSFELSDFGLDVDTSNILTLTKWESENFDPNKNIDEVFTDRAELYTTYLNNNSYVRIIESESDLSQWSIYRWDEEAGDVEKVSQNYASLHINDVILHEEITKAENDELRIILDIVFNEFMIPPYDDIVNNVLFAMVRFVITEQPNNNWVFPTTYISIIEDQVSLVQYDTYQGSTIDDVTKYIREAKPYHTKIKEYSRINRPEQENSKIRVTDFDKPVWVGSDLSLQVLQEIRIDKFAYDEVDEDGLYTLTLPHTHEVNVFDDGEYVNRNKYEIGGDKLKLKYTPEKGLNHQKSIVVESRNIPVQEHLEEWRKSWGYGEELRDTKDLIAWEDYSIQKKIKIVYDRNWPINALSFEQLSDVIDNIKVNPTPMQYIDEISLNRDPDKDYILNTKDRNILMYHEDKILEIVDASDVFIVTDYNMVIPYTDSTEGMSVIVNNEHIGKHLYNQDTSGITFNFDIFEGDYVEVRPYQKLKEMYVLENVLESFRQKSTMFASEGFTVDTSSLVINVDKLKTTTYVNIEDSDLIETTETYEFVDGGIDIYSQGEFTNNYDGSNEEFFGLRIHESIILTSVSRVPEFAFLTVEDDITDIGFQEEVVIVTEGEELSYSFNKTAPAYHIKVRKGNELLIKDIHYHISDDGIFTLRQVYEEGTEIVLNDMSINSDLTTIFNPDIVYTRNADGTYNVLEELGDLCGQESPTREFIVYGKDGRRHLFRTRLYDYFKLVAPTQYGNVFEIDEDPEDIEGTYRDNKFMAIVGTDADQLENTNSIINFELIRGTIKDGEVVDTTRALYNGDSVDFTGYKHVYLYELEYEEFMDTFAVIDQKEGSPDSDNYPKLTHILFRGNALPVYKRT